MQMASSYARYPLQQVPNTPHGSSTRTQHTSHSTHCGYPQHHARFPASNPTLSCRNQTRNPGHSRRTHPRPFSHQCSYTYEVAALPPCQLGVGCIPRHTVYTSRCMHNQSGGCITHAESLLNSSRTVCETAACESKPPKPNNQNGLPSNAAQGQQQKRSRHITNSHMHATTTD